MQRGTLCCPYLFRIKLNAHARLCSVNPSSLPAFIVRLFREKNKDGFIKAFTDMPEQITSGLFPLRTLVKELMVRRIHVYPRCVESNIHRNGGS